MQLKHGEVKVKHTFLISVLDGGEWSVSCSGHYDMTAGCYNAVLIDNCLHYMENTVATRMIKSKRMRWVVHVAHIGEMRN
jgi:hypothetical protein